MNVANKAGKASIAARFSDGACRLSEGKSSFRAQPFQLKFGIDGKVRPSKRNVRLEMLGSVGSENSEAKLGMPKLTVGKLRSKLIVGSVILKMSNRPSVASTLKPNELRSKVSTRPPESGMTSPLEPFAR